MKKLAIILGALGVVIVAIIILLANLGSIVNRNKGALLSRAEKAVGRKITVGDIGITLRGGIGIRLEDFALADDPAFSTEPFIAAKDLQVNAKLWPLFKKEFQIKRVILHDPVIHVVRDEQGRLNTQSARSAAPGTGGTNDTEDAAATASPLVVSFVNVDGGELHYTDRMTGTELRITRIDTRVEGLDPNRPVTFDAKAALLSDAQNVSLKGTLGPLGDGSAADSTDLDVSVNVAGIDIESLLRTFPAVASSIPPGAAVGGPVKVDAHVGGRFAHPSLHVDLDLNSLTIRLADTFTKAEGIPLTLSTDADYTAERVNLRNTKIRFHTLEATASGSYRMTTPPAIDLSLSTSDVSLDGWQVLVPALEPLSLAGTARFAGTIKAELQPGTVPLANGTVSVRNLTAHLPQLLKPITNAQAEITLAGTRAEAKAISAEIGGSKMSGSASIQSFKPLTATYAVNSTAVALDDVRPPNPKLKRPDVLKSVAVQGKFVAEGEHVRNDGSLSSKDGTFADVDYRNLRADFSSVDKVTTFKNVSADALDGTVTGEGTIKADKDAPQFDFTTKANNLNFAQLIDKLPTQAKQMMRGRASMELRITGQGKEWKDIEHTIDGSGLAELLEGAVIDYNVFTSALGQLGQLTGSSNWVSQRVRDKYPGIFNTPNTEFQNLKSDFVIEKGKLRARNLALAAKNYSLQGKGAVDLEKNLDMSLTLTLSKGLTTDLINDVKEATYLTNAAGQIEVPFALSGALPKPRVQLEEKFLGSVLQKALTSKGLDLLKDKGLKDLFGGKRSAPPDTTKKN